jgi:transitional endoplasmic reticulum ATPase
MGYFSNPSAETSYLNYLCPKCRAKVLNGNYKDFCSDCQQKLIFILNESLAKLRKLEQQIEKYKSQLLSGPLEWDIVSRSLEISPSSGQTIEGVLTSKGNFLTYGMLSKNDIKEIKEGKKMGVIYNMDSGEIVAPFEIDPPLEEGKIKDIIKEENGDISIKIEIGGRDVIKRYNKNNDKVSPDKLEVGNKVLLTPGTEDIFKAYKPQIVPQFHFKTLKNLKMILFEDIGGLEDIKQKAKELIDYLKNKDVLESIGVQKPVGVLFIGFPGTGKTMMARAMAFEASLEYIEINMEDIVTKYFGEPEQRIKEIFEYAGRKAREAGGAILFIDEIDALAMQREESSEIARRITSALLKEMDNIEKNKDNIIVIGATNIPEDLDPALLRPGRFDYLIEFPLPDEKARRKILEIYTRSMKEASTLSEDVNLDYLAKVTHGYTGADIMSLCREAGYNALRENRDNSQRKNIKIEMRHFEDALKRIVPTPLRMLREYNVEIPKITFEDVGGLEEAKEELRNLIILPLKYPELARHLNIEENVGVLLYGPTGVGKTLLAKAVAGEAGIYVLWIAGPQLYNKFVGEGEKAVRRLFRLARLLKPCIIIIDEIDSLLPPRGTRYDSGASHSLVSQFLTEMDGIRDNPGIYVIGTTNRPDLIDPAVLRPGRIGKLIEIRPPDKKARLEIYKIHTRSIPLAEDVNLDELASREGYTGADIKEICNIVKEKLFQKIYKDLKEGKYGKDEINYGELLKKYKVSKDDFNEAIELYERKRRGGYELHEVPDKKGTSIIY